MRRPAQLVVRVLYHHPKKGYLLAQAHRRGHKGKPKLFKLPGGGAHVHAVQRNGQTIFVLEPPRQTAHREFFEETGAKPLGLRRFHSTTITKDNGQREHIIVYQARNIQGKPKASKEIKRLNWHKPGKKNLHLAPHTRDLIAHHQQQTRPKQK